MEAHKLKVFYNYTKAGALNAIFSLYKTWFAIRYYVIKFLRYFRLPLLNIIVNHAKTGEVKNITYAYYLRYGIDRYYQKNPDHMFYVKMYNPTKTNHLIYNESLENMDSDITTLPEPNVSMYDNIFIFSNTQDQQVPIDILTLSRIYRDNANKKINLGRLLDLIGYRGLVKYLEILSIFSPSKLIKHKVNDINLDDIYTRIDGPYENGSQSGTYQGTDKEIGIGSHDTNTGVKHHVNVQGEINMPNGKEPGIGNTDKHVDNDAVRDLNIEN